MARRKSRSKKSQPQFVLWMGVIFLIILAVIFGGYYSGNSAADTPAINNDTSLPLEISVTEAYEMRESGAFMLDVRTQAEWEDFHMPGATLIVLDDLANQLASVPVDREIVIVCRSGNRSQVGRDILLDAGYTHVTSMSGGMNEWVAAGYEYLTGP